LNSRDAHHQPFDVFLCHNTNDKPAVKELANQLKAQGYKPWLDEWELQPGIPWQTVLEEQIQSVNSAAVFVGSSGFGPWQNMELNAFIRQFVKRKCPVIPVLLPGAPKELELPVLLDGMNYIDFNRKDQDHTPLQQLIWGITGKNPNYLPNPIPGSRPGTLSPPELFVGREEPLKDLIKGLSSEGGTAVITGRLFNLEGAGGMGKTTLAREAAWRLRDQFPQGVFEITMDDHTPMTFAMELARKLDQNPKEPSTPSGARMLVTQLLANQRLLLILDNLIHPVHAPYLLPLESPSAVVITTRNKDCLKLLKQKRGDLELSGINLKRFTPAEALSLFREILAEAYQEHSEPLYLKIAGVLGHLPVALRPALNLMVFSPRYSPDQLLEKLKSPELHDLLQKGAENDGDLRTVKAVFDLGQTWLPGPSHRKVLEHLACCGPGPVPLDFLDQFCEEEGLQERLEDLSARSWCQGRDTEQGRAYVMHDLVRDVVRSQYQHNPWDRFVDLVDKAFREEPFPVKDRWLPQFQEALSLCEHYRDRRQIGWLYRAFHDYCEQRGHGALYVRLADQATRLFPEDEVLSVATNHKALILRDWGHLEEAYKLLEQSAEIMQRREDKQGLAACYGNQALILSAWGKLEDAHALHKKEEEIKEALGDRAGLARSYGNQALILSDWGKLEDAHALHKKEEEIKEALGDRAGLARSYGNQALILKAWGKLEDAHALHKKEEEIKEALGDRAGLAACYGNQALILKAWGKLEDAHALHKKEEALCEALGDRAGLALSFWNQGSLLKKQGDRAGQEALWRKALAMYREIGLPTDFMEGHLKNLTEG